MWPGSTVWGRHPLPVVAMPGVAAAGSWGFCCWAVPIAERQTDVVVAGKAMSL